MIETDETTSTGERCAIATGRVLSSTVRYNVELDSISFRFSNHMSILWRSKVGKEYAKDKFIPEEEIEWFSDPHKKLASYSSFDPCTFLYNARREITELRVAQLKYHRLPTTDPPRIPSVLLFKELVGQGKWKVEIVRKMFQKAKIPKFLYSLRDINKVENKNLKHCLTQIIGEHFRCEAYFLLSPFIPPSYLKKLSVEELSGLAETVKASPFTLSFAHSISATIIESALLQQEEADQETVVVVKQQMEQAVKDQIAAAKVLHSIPEVKGAKGLGNVAGVMNSNQAELQVELFLAADAYVSFSRALDDFGNDSITMEEEEKELSTALSNTGMVEVVGESKYSLTRTSQLNKKLLSTLTSLLEELPRSPHIHEHLLSDTVRPEKRQCGPDRQTVRYPVQDLKTAVKEHSLVLIRTEGIEWLREYIPLFQQWRYPSSDQYQQSPLAGKQRALFVVPTYADHTIFYEHTGLDSLIAERAELGTDGHYDHLNDVLADIKRCPASIHYLVLVHAQQFDVLTLLETLQMGLDIFSNLQSIVLIGDDQIHPAPPRSRPLDSVHGKIPPCGQAFGFPFRDLILKSNLLPSTTVLRTNYTSSRPYNCIPASSFYNLSLALDELRQGLHVEGMHLSTIYDWSTDPLGTRAVSSLLRLWAEEAEMSSVTSSSSSSSSKKSEKCWAPVYNGLGREVVMLLSTPSHWSKEECWGAADLVSSELRRECKKNVAVNTVRYAQERIYLEETGTLEVIENSFRYQSGRAFPVSHDTPLGLELPNGATREQALIELYGDPVIDHRDCKFCKHRIPEQESQMFPAFGAHDLHCGIVIPARFWRPTPTPLIVLFPVTAACGLENIEQTESSTLTDIKTALSYTTRMCVLVEHGEAPLKTYGTLTRETIFSLLVELQNSNRELV